MLLFSLSPVASPCTPPSVRIEGTGFYHKIKSRLNDYLSVLTQVEKFSTEDWEEVNCVIYEFREMKQHPRCFIKHLSP